MPAGGGRRRCSWCGDDPLYVRYHDDEWGRPLRDDRRLFEKLCLEGFQSGLSWLTILRKRENFQRRFLDFDWRALSRRGVPFVAAALQDAGIVRHRGKIESVLNNARRAVEAEERPGGLTEWWWSFAPPPSRRFGGIRPTSPESVALSKELKRAGWSFVGPTTVYAMMQSAGMVNDHLPGCFARAACARERRPAPPGAADRR